jgi:hypothetical protein
MWTYCYGYYLEGALEKSIFEQHQERLEKFTEHLHGLSEMPLSELLDNKIRADVVNYTRVSLLVGCCSLLLHLADCSPPSIVITSCPPLRMVSRRQAFSSQ